MRLNIGDAVLIKGEEKNRGVWKMGIVERLIIGKDGVIRAATLRAGKSTLQRAIQHLYPLELNCNRDSKISDDRGKPTCVNVQRTDQSLQQIDFTCTGGRTDDLSPLNDRGVIWNIDVPEFRPRRNASAVAKVQISNQMNLEHDGPLVE